ncbi:unnamed protein product [Euphydryas editha]|uniref:Uncharacterized protein n=1 Tax=Euphydryas editha TaxID=104508 RepID=A0AAU9UF30_EUPED|nr:unnamed protein product [Euphydryas editha]
MTFTLHIIFLVITDFFIINSSTSEESRESIKPIFRYLKSNSVKSCEWCNMKPEKHRHDVNINRDLSESKEVIDLFDIPVLAAMAQNKGRINKQIISDAIGRLN